MSYLIIVMSSGSAEIYDKVLAFNFLLNWQLTAADEERNKKNIYHAVFLKVFTLSYYEGLVEIIHRTY